jgi:hypothetical protein
MVLDEMLMVKTGVKDHQRQAEQASALMAFTNKSTILRKYELIRFKHKFITISTKQRTTNQILLY